MNTDSMRWPSDFPGKHDNQDGWVKHRKESQMGKARNIADAEERFVNIWNLSCQQND